MNITLIRHAQTPGNRKKQYIGRTDEDIVAPPSAVSEEVGTVYVTPLKRTGQTAAALFPNRTQRVVPGLSEMDFGIFEGKSYLDMEHFAPYRNWVEGGCLGTCPEGESRETFSKRVWQAFGEQVHGTREDELIFVVHGGVIMALMHRLCPQYDLYHWHCDNGAGYCFDFSEKGAQNIREVRFCT